MCDAVERGIRADGILPGGLNLNRKAKILFEKRCYNESADVTMNRLIAAYAYAVSEENASENIVVTAPTCTEAGYTTHTCSRCSDSYTDSTVAALGHDLVNHAARAAT